MDRRVDTMESELILSVQAGNKAAFDELVNIYSRRIYHLAYSFLHNVDDAADIVQEVFLRAYRNFSRFDPTRALYPWLYRITKNLCINRYQRAANRERTLPGEELIASATLDPLNEAVRNEEAEAIRKAVDNLPPMHREILIMKHFHDCSYAEMAEILSVPVGTVMSRLCNARAKLRKELMEVEIPT